MPGAFQSSSQAANFPRSSATCDGVSDGPGEVAAPLSRKVTNTGPSGKFGTRSSNSTTPDLNLPGIVFNMNPQYKNRQSPASASSPSSCSRDGSGVPHDPFADSLCL